MRSSLSLSGSSSLFGSLLRSSGSGIPIPNAGLQAASSRTCFSASIENLCFGVAKMELSLAIGGPSGNSVTSWRPQSYEHCSIPMEVSGLSPVRHRMTSVTKTSFSEPSTPRTSPKVERKKLKRALSGEVTLVDLAASVEAATRGRLLLKRACSKEYESSDE